MAEQKRDAGIKVNDRRLFTAEGELRNDTVEEVSTPVAEVRVQDAPVAAPVTAPPSAAPTPDAPLPPTASEQQAQHDAYKQSSRDLDTQVELGGHSAKDLEISFERFLASLYMTAMMQLGLMMEKGGAPQVDLIGARQTIDTLGMLGEKTKGNLTPKEQAFFQNALYELRMAYVEVTNALAHPPGPSTGTNG